MLLSRRSLAYGAVAAALAALLLVLLSTQQGGGRGGSAGPTQRPLDVEEAVEALPAARWSRPLPLAVVADDVVAPSGADVDARADCQRALGLRARVGLRDHDTVGQCTPRPGREALDSRARYARLNATATWADEDVLEVERAVVDFGKIRVVHAGVNSGQVEYARGAVTLACTPDAGMAERLDPPMTNDAMRQAETVMATGLVVNPRPGEDVCAHADARVRRTTVVLARDSTALSQFHNMLEPIGLFLAAVSSTLTGATDDFQVLLLDGHHYVPEGQGPGNLVPVMETFSRYPVIDGRRFGTQRVCFDRLVYAVSGWHTYYYQPEHVWERDRCPVPSAALLSFRARVLHGLGFLPNLDAATVARHAACVAPPASSPSRSSGSPPRLRLLYLKRTGARSVMENEDELYALVGSVAGQVAVTTAEFTYGQTVETQIAALHAADLVLSVHGASLVNMVFARPGTAFVELVPRSHVDVKLFANLAAFLCLAYYAVNAFSDVDVDAIHINGTALLPVVLAVLAGMHA